MFSNADLDDEQEAGSSENQRLPEDDYECRVQERLVEYIHIAIAGRKRSCRKEIQLPEGDAAAGKKYNYTYSSRSFSTKRS